MNRKIKKSGKKTVSLALAAAMVVTGLNLESVPLWAATAVEREDSSIIYFVDCGDLDPETVPEDGQLGTHNSVTEQLYGEDPVTGYKWGIDDGTDELPSGSCGVGGISTDWTWPMESVTGDQVSKTSTNRYTKNQYENGIQTRYLDYKFELENGEYLVEVGFADPWGCSQSPSVYANYGKEDEQVIKENFLVSSNDGVVTETVKVTDGELTINARATGSSNLAINMTYIEIRMTGDTAMAQADAGAISIPASATADIELPTTGSKVGSAITWASDNENVITPEGKVTRPAAGEEDANVKLTASVTYGAETITKDFYVTVPAISELMGLEFFEDEAVEVTDAYYDEALQLDVDNLLALDKDRLLAGFRETAAYAYLSNHDSLPDNQSVSEFMKNKTRYGGGWENSLIGGHTMGHYMSAVAQAIVNPGTSAEDKEALIERMDYLVESLAECQAMTEGTDYEGYIFGATLPNSTFQKDVDLQFDNVEKSLSNIATQAWVPWYTMHKILAGLTDAYEVSGNEQALEVANKLATWISNRANGWDTATQNRVLAIEYGGMNDALYQLYKVNDALAQEGDARAASNYEDFKAAAHMFDEVTLFKSVLSGRINALNGKHANTTIPKFLGALCRYEVDNSESDYLQYAEAFWQMVIDNHTYITGGNSEDEHFGADNVLDAERTDANNETCNTYNMLKLSRRLFIITGDKKYADYYENTLINAIMSSQNHETGLTMYFQPMATGYQKVFGTLENSFWCCTGSGMENFTKLQDSIYFRKDGLVVVNQYLASTVEQDGYTLVQTGDLSKGETMAFTLTEKKEDGIDFGLRLRVPEWVPGGNVTVSFGDVAYEYTTRNGYIVIPNEMIKDGATFTVTLPMEIRAYNLPDGENTYAFKYGPFVLSAQLGTEKQTTGSHGVAVTVPSTKAVSSDSLGIKAAETVEEFIENISDYLVKAQDSLTFTLTGTSTSYTFIPHYQQDTQSYGIYWRYYIDEEGRGAEAVLAEKQENRIADATIGIMAQAGRGQYENQFTLADGTSVGLIDEKDDSIGEDAPNLTRRAAAGSSFGYMMEVVKGEDNYLLLTYAKADDGKPVKISVGDTVIAEEVLDSSNAAVNNLTLADADQNDYYQVMYKISADVVAANAQTINVLDAEGKTAAKDVITVMFAGTADSESARICKSVVMLKAFSSENALTSVTYAGSPLTVSGTTYNLTVPYNETPEVTFAIADANGYVEVNGTVIDEKEARKLMLSGTETAITVKVYAADFTTAKTYTLKVTRDFTGATEGLKENLVKAFTFDDTVDEAVAVTRVAGSGANPTVLANAEYSYVDGVKSKAVSLTGTYGLRLLEDASVLGDSYTISFWMNPSKLGGEYDPIFTAGTFTPQYWLNLTADGKLWSDNGAWVSADATNCYKTNEWQQVTAVIDGTTAGTVANTVVGRLYVNGELVSEGNVAKGIMTRSKAAVYLGVNGWDAYLQGAVDEILLFNKALTDGEVAGIVSKSVTSYGLEGKEDPTKTEEKPSTPGTPGAPSTNTNTQTQTPAATAAKDNTITVKKTSYSKTYSTKAQSFSIGATATAGKVTYASNNSSITVNKNTGKVTIKKKYIGKATITITSSANGYKTATKTITVTVTPKKSAVSGKTAKSKGFKVSYKKVAGAGGYEVQYSTSKKFTKKTTTTKTSKKTSYTAKKLKAKKTYYVRVRAYKKVSGTKIYSAWSTAVKIKTK